MKNLQHPTNVLWSIHAYSKKALQFVWKCVAAFFQCSIFEFKLFLFPILEVIALKSNLSEAFVDEMEKVGPTKRKSHLSGVPIKQSFSGLI